MGRRNLEFNVSKSGRIKLWILLVRRLPSCPVCPLVSLWSALFALRNWTLSINKHNIHHTHYQNFEFFYSKQQNLPTLEADPIVEEEFPFSGKLGGRPRANPSFHFMRTNEAIKWQQMAWVASVWPFGSLTWKESATLKLKWHSRIFLHFWRFPSGTLTVNIAFL